MKKICLVIVILCLLSIMSSPAAAESDFWHDTDWTDGQYADVLGVDIDASPGELILENDTSSLVFAFDPTDWEGIYTLEVYKDKLYLGACTRPCYVNGGDIIGYDYQTNTCQLAYQVFEQGIIKMRTLNEKLYIPGFDSMGTWRWGNIYIYDGETWVRKETIPYAVHVFEVGFYKDKLYVSALTFENGEWRIKLYESENEADTWAEVKFEEMELLKSRDYYPEKFYSMTVFNDEFYVYTRGTPYPDLKKDKIKYPNYNIKNIIVYNGKEWRAEQLPRSPTGMTSFEVFNNKLYILEGTRISFDNNSQWVSVNLHFQSAHFKVYGYAIKAYDGRLFISTNDGRLYVSNDGENWNLECTLGKMDEWIASLEVFHGRLYAGTVKSGTVYVSASTPSGMLISKKHNFNQPLSKGTISWNALAPASTSVKFQLRSAETALELEYKEFVGPDGTNLSYYEIPGTFISEIHKGDCWMQYKVYLKTNDPALMPVLEDVTIIAFEEQSDDISQEQQSLELYGF